MGWKVAGGEFVVGLIMGITLQFVFEGVELAGQVVGFQVGHSLANLINPLIGCGNTHSGQFLPGGGAADLSSVGRSPLGAAGVGEEFSVLSAGSGGGYAGHGGQMWRAAGGMLIIAVQIAIPALLATMLTDIALGFLGRASPQLPVLFVGISVKSDCGFSGDDGDAALLAFGARTLFRRSAGDQRATDASGALTSEDRLWRTKVALNKQHHDDGNAPAARATFRAAGSCPPRWR